MKISDEIRELCDIGACHDELRALANRIDREMVELPKDRDGVPIHVGDTVYGCKNGYRYQVRALRLEDEWSISTNRGVFIDPSILTHTRPDSLRRIADELEEWSEDNRVNGSSDVFTRAADLADRIRKLAESEDKGGQMQPTSEERREVAARLREMGPSADKHGLDYDDVCQRVDEIIDTVECGSWEVVFDRLADLIEPQERTCRILQAYGDKGEELDHCMEEIAYTPEDTVACICQSCGHEFRYDRMVRPTFCPNCGARNATEVD